MNSLAVSPIKGPLPTKEELLARYQVACDLKQRVRPDVIEAKLGEWIARVSREKMRVRVLKNSSDIDKAAKDARDARDARNARVARDAWVAWVARDAWDAKVAWDARAARIARIAWDARDAKATRDARAAWIASGARDAMDAWDASWVSAIVVGAAATQNEKLFEIWSPLFEAFEAGAFCFWITEDEILVTPIPERVSMDDRRRLHAENGPAFRWLADVADFYWHGVYVPEYVVLRPHEIAVDKIDAETNAEVRRVMMERYGFGRYIVDSGTREVQRDDFGVLYRKEQPIGDPIVCVKVVNSTAEPDGSFKDYWLRVAPDLRPLPPGEWPDDKKREWFARQQPQVMTAHNAVASTFGLRGEEYSPEIET